VNASSPQVPSLDPEQKKVTISLFIKLPSDRKKLVKQLIRQSCSWCEKQFKIPNAGLSHGICNRHKEEVYKQMNKQNPPSKNKYTAVDLETVSKEEIQLAINIVKLIHAKGKV
jgi:hypothetical protein